MGSRTSCLFASDFIVAVMAKSAQGPWLNGHIMLLLCFTFFLSFHAFISLLKLPWLFLLIQYLACIKMFRGINRHGAAHTFASFGAPSPLQRAQDLPFNLAVAPTCPRT